MFFIFYLFCILKIGQQKIVKQTSGQLKKQEFANRLLMVEIQCLKGQLSELDNDYKSLGRMTSLDEPDSTDGIDFSNAAAKLVDGNGSLEISDFVHNGAELQLKNTDSESEEVRSIFFPFHPNIQENIEQTINIITYAGNPDEGNDAIGRCPSS